ncbi:MAG: HlyC/CorC family transporter [Lachnospiraceae bacterium]|nr:HlyC/CorC family transporter [Lachnospiraceae bacterium]
MFEFKKGDDFLTSEDAIQLLALLFLVMLSAFFSSAETALTTVNRIRLQALCAEGDKRAAVVLKVVENSSKMLSSILIGNNLVNNFSAALATALAIKMFGNGAVGIVTGILTIAILIFGEITPKTFATANAERLSLAYASVILLLMKILTPIIVIINTICRYLLKLLHVDTDRSLNTMTEMELRTIVEVSHKDGVIEKEEREMIYNVVDFGDSQAKDVMVPRADVVSVSDTSSYSEIREVFRMEKYTRLPVYQGDRDNIIGILNIKDFFFCNDTEDFKVSDIMYEPYFTYEYKKTSELLMEMQKSSVSIAVVLDEYGAAVGMVSLEDLLEEIVGEIRDEYDEDEKDLIQKVSDCEYIIEGSVKLDDVNDTLQLALSSDEYDSIGGLIIEKLDHLPTEHESVITEEGISLTVMQMDKNRIESVRLVLPQPQEESGETSEADGSL